MGSGLNDKTCLQALPGDNPALAAKINSEHLGIFKHNTTVVSDGLGQTSDGLRKSVRKCLPIGTIR
jgi:hypothetical protein